MTMYPIAEQLERNRKTAAHFGLDPDRSSPADAITDLALFCGWATSVSHSYQEAAE